MISLSNFFQKFRHLENSKQEQISSFISIVKNVCSINLSSTEIIVGDSYIQVRTSPLKRNEIFMHKDEILAQLKALGSKTVSLR